MGYKSAHTWPAAKATPAQRERPDGLEQTCTTCGAKRTWCSAQTRWRYGDKSYTPPVCAPAPAPTVLGELADAVAARRAEDPHELMLAVKTVLRALDADAAAIMPEPGSIHTYDGLLAANEAKDQSRSLHLLAQRLDAWAGANGLFRKP